MSIAPEQVLPPARDTVLFRSSPARTFLAVFAVVTVSFLAAAPIVAVVARHTDSWWANVVQAVVIAGLAAGGYAYCTRAALATWVRVSAGGLELAAQGSDPILLAWADVSSVVLRQDGIRTVLEVWPVDWDSVHPVAADGPGWPTMIRTVQGAAFTADLSEVWPGPRTLRRELAERMHPAH